jgi:hypothetical protein
MTAVFDGGLNTAQAPADAGAVALGSRYFWGTELQGAKPDGGVAWLGQTMVFPIVWH